MPLVLERATFLDDGDDGLVTSNGSSMRAPCAYNYTKPIIDYKRRLHTHKGGARAGARCWAGRWAWHSC